MKYTPKVSIIITVYNLESIVSNCIESCIRQSFQDIEIVVVNDGSTDESEKVIDHYKRSDSRIKLISKENEGSAIARKTGVEQSSGAFIFHLDGDDTITVDAIDSLYNQAMLHNADITAGDVILYKGNSFYQQKMYSDFGSGSGIKFLEFILINRLHYLCGKLIKYSVYSDNEIEIGKKVSIGEDQCEMSQLCMFAGKVTTIKKIVYEYRLNDSSITQKQISDQEFTKRQEYYADVMFGLLQKFTFNDLIRQQINWRILRALYEALYKTGDFIVDKKKSKSILSKTLFDSIFSSGTIFFKHFQLLSRCVAVLIYPKLAFKLRNSGS